MDTRKDSAHKLLELNSLIEFSQLINSNLDLKFILGNILLSIMGKMLISKGMVLIKKESDTTQNLFNVESCKGVSLFGSSEEIEYEFPKDPFFVSDDLKDDGSLFKKNDLKFFFKIYFDSRLLGVLCLGSKLNKDKELSTSEIIFIETLLNLSASSIENTIKFNQISRLNTDINSKYHQLKSLFELSKEFNTNFINRDKIIRLLNYTLLGNFGIRDFLIISKYRSEKYHLLNPSKINIDDFDLTGLKAFTKPSIISKSSEVKFISYLADKGYELLVPTMQNGEVENIICIGKKLNRSEYSQSDIEFLESIINLSVISIENSILFEEYLEKQQIENELKIAREIQLALLPDFIPIITNYDVAACNIPALHVGGDYYDVIKLSESVFAFVIADVSGKGTPASLLMSNIQSSVHSYLKLYDEGGFDLSKATYKINELIYENTSSEKFITFFWGILDTKDNSFTYINAGHNQPILHKSGEIELLDKGGIMIGIMDVGVEYEVGKITLEKNDVLIFYTDGVTEAQDADKDEFGEERLTNILKSDYSKPAQVLLDKINSEVVSFASNVKQFDDITAIVLKRTE